jgi:hypothetical protein
MTDEHETHYLSKGRWVFYGFLALAGVLLLTEHRAHLLGFWPFLILLACPLLHYFMHGKHGNHEHRHETQQEGEGK